MSFQFKNPTSQVVTNSPNSVALDSNSGTNFSIFQIGGYMEVFSISDLLFTIPENESGTILYSGNTIPIDFSYNAPLNADNVINLYSDGVSSGRRKLGMLVYVNETNTVYQFNIPNYETLFNNAEAAGSLTNIGTGYQCINDTESGALFISSWTGNTIEGVEGAIREESNWVIFNSQTYITGGTYTSNDLTLTLRDNAGGDVIVTGFTAGTNVRESGEYRILASDGTDSGIVAQSGLTFSANVLHVSGSVTFDTAITTGVRVPSQLVWNDTDGTLDLTMKGGLVTQQIGQEIYYPPVVNRTGSILREGTLVMVNPMQVSHGNRLNVIKAISDGSYPSILLVGVVTEDIAINGEGFATWFGYVRNLKKSDLETYQIKPISETWVVGNVLWANPDLNGGYTNAEPSAPHLKVPVAAITDINGQNITIMVRPRLTPSLGDINNIQTSGADTGDLIIYDNMTGIWSYSKELKGDYIISGSTTIGDLTGATPTKIVGSNATGKLSNITLTTTGSTGSATIIDGKLNIPQYSAGIVGSGNTNEIVFWTGSTGIGGYSGFTWNNSEKKLVINYNGLESGNGTNNNIFNVKNGFLYFDNIATTTVPSLVFNAFGTNFAHIYGSQSGENSKLLFGGINSITTAPTLSVLSIDIDDYKIGIRNDNPVKTLDVSGETRVRDLTGSTATNLIGASDDGDLAKVELTTTGNTGPATILNGKLNIPQYSGSSAISGSGENQQITFWNSQSGITGSNNLLWDGTTVVVNGAVQVSGETVSSFKSYANNSLLSIYNSNNSSSNEFKIEKDSKPYFGVRNGQTYFGDYVINSSQYYVRSTGNTNSTTGFTITNIDKNPYLVILDDGSSGFNVVNPSAKIHIKGSGNTGDTYSLKVENSDEVGVFYIRDDGKIGVGISNPTKLLDVNGSTITQDLFIVNTQSKISSDGVGGIELNYGSGDISGNNIFSVYSGSVTPMFQIYKSGNVYLNGNMGININNPTKTLHVSGETRITNLTGSTANTLIGSSTDGDLAKIELTTTGTSGSATILNGKLNIPQYQASITGETTQVAFWDDTNSLTGSTRLTFNGNKLYVYGEDTAILQVSGSSGNLVEVVNEITGNLLEVGTIEGKPMLAVNTDGFTYINGGTLTLLQSSSGTLKQIDSTKGVSAFIEYSIYTFTKTVMRNGILYIIWNGSTAAITDTVGVTIGDSSNLTFSIEKNSNDINIKYTNAGSSAYYMVYSARVI